MQNKISENMEYYGVNSFVKNTSEKVTDFAKTTGEKVSDIAKTTGEKVTDMAKTTATYIKDKSTDLYENNQYVHNAVDNIGTHYTNIKEKSIQFASDAYTAASSYVNTNLNPQGAKVEQAEPSPDPRSIADQLKDDKI